MRSARLDFALESGALVLPPEGPVVVYRPREGDDLSSISIARIRVATGFRPDAEWFAARGYQAAEGPPYAAAVVCLPRARDAARALISRAMVEVVPGGPVAVDGQKTDGIDSILKDCRAMGLALSGPVSKAHGKTFVLQAGADLTGWDARPRLIDGGFQTLPGVFSADGPDRGSALLAQALPEKLGTRVIDLGAGWGYLSRAILTRSSVAELDVVEAERDALDCATVNVADARARFHWADARSFKPLRPAHSVVMNPPFHAGRDADPALGVAFLRAAASMLVPDGTLWLVANRHLPYHQPLSTLFRQVEDIGGDSAFRLTRASHPLRVR
ncbi:class I SAM-dependent methyltransferase [Pseudorhodobacter sp. MZDSW-24AT]|uniref:class I SAM-dependent methyltransferase n=1 Tax=Pseudorhodobacter sp. MZDSW-24AT TaxID=2052957 RepID=UPI000C1E1D97|nr:methyltransferase [Pseudorhodobacter sp. MZDSW-24AT]PJF10118.1 MFS transporter [Pseudorhodobacter sp. MZDSW-24AT]